MRSPDAGRRVRRLLAYATLGVGVAFGVGAAATALADSADPDVVTETPAPASPGASTDDFRWE